MTRDFIQSSSFVFQAIIIGTAFYSLVVAFYSCGRLLDILPLTAWLIITPSSLLFAALTAQAEIPALFAQRPIVARHQKVAMYHPFIEAAALTLVDIPITFITLVVYTLILYFLVGLQASAGQYLCVYFHVFDIPS